MILELEEYEPPRMVVRSNAKKKVIHLTDDGERSLCGVTADDWATPSEFAVCPGCRRLTGAAEKGGMRHCSKCAHAEDAKPRLKKVAGA